MDGDLRASAAQSLGHDDTPPPNKRTPYPLVPLFLNAHTLCLARMFPPPPPVRAYELTGPPKTHHTQFRLAPRHVTSARTTRFPSHRHKQPLTGVILTQHELVNLAKHPSRDVAALGLKGADIDNDDDEGEGDGERRVLDDIRSRGIPFSPLPLRRRVIGQSDALQIVGYEVRESPGGIGQGEDPGMMMVRAKGELAARTALQAFVSTNHATLNPGMCGAAVLDRDMELCGCVEGVVPTAPPGEEVEPHVRALQGMPCVVEWNDLDALLKVTMDDANSADSADDE